MEIITRIPDGQLIPGKAREYARKLFTVVAANEPITDDILLVMTELITNAMIHGKGVVGVDLYIFTDRIRIEITDNGEPLPVKRSPKDQLATSGRGLYITEILSNQWGVAEPQRLGTKMVWSEFSRNVA